MIADQLQRHSARQDAVALWLVAAGALGLGDALALEQQRAAEAAEQERRRALARDAGHAGGEPLGCSALTIWEGGSDRGAIDPNGIVRRDGLVAGKVQGDGRVLARDVLLGRVDPEGRVGFDGKSIGRLDAKGAISRRGEWVGELQADGRIVWRGKLWGKVVGYTGSVADRRAVIAYLLLFAGTFH